MSSRIDWAAVRSRLDQARAALERTAAPAAEEAARILKARAKALAQAPAVAREEGAFDVVEFVVAHEIYAVEAKFVQQVSALSQFTPVPGTPPYVRGVVNLRGETVSVIDIRKLFDLPEEGLADLHQVIVLRHGRMSFGILADSVSGIRRAVPSEMQASLPTLTGTRERYLRGITRDRRIVLDAERLINDPQLIVRYERADRRNG